MISYYSQLSASILLEYLMFVNNWAYRSIDQVGSPEPRLFTKPQTGRSAVKRGQSHKRLSRSAEFALAQIATIALLPGRK